GYYEDLCERPSDALAQLILAGEGVGEEAPLDGINIVVRAGSRICGSGGAVLLVQECLKADLLHVLNRGRGRTEGGLHEEPGSRGGGDGGIRGSDLHLQGVGGRRSRAGIDHLHRDSSRGRRGSGGAEAGGGDESRLEHCAAEDYLRAVQE